LSDKESIAQTWLNSPKRGIKAAALMNDKEKSG
jgi:hypothetical protein